MSKNYIELVISMPKENRYRHYDLNQAKRLTLNIASFGGVDYSSQKLQVSQSRAIDLINFIYKDGVIQKRQGYTQKAVVPTISYIAIPSETTADVLTNTSKAFNGIWHFLAEDGQYHTIAHIGKLLFEIKDLDKQVVKFDLLYKSNALGKDTIQHKTTYEHLDQKSMAFVGNNRLWFLGGNKYMVIGFRKQDSQLIYEPVEESQLTFVPTTTTTITYKNSLVKGRSSFDYANILTMWRKNTCLSGTGKSDADLRQTKYYEYTLDAPLKVKTTKSDLENGVISNDTKRQLSKIKIKIEEIVMEER